MIDQLKTGTKVVGAKQTGRALKEESVRCVFLAGNADPHVTEPIRTLCGEKNVPVEDVTDMKELGRACEIAVGAAVAALLKD